MAKRQKQKHKRSGKPQAPKPRCAIVLQAIVQHMAIKPLDGVASILKLHSTVQPFPAPVTPTMSLFNDFRLAPLGREAMADDLTELRRALGKPGSVGGEAARKAEYVSDLVKLVS